MLKIGCIEVEHTQMKLFIIHSYKYVSCTAELTYMHTSIHSTCSSHPLTEKYGYRSKNGQDHLSYEEVVPQPATSLQRSTQP